MSSRISSNSEASASKLLENLEGMSLGTTWTVMSPTVHTLQCTPVHSSTERFEA